MTSNYDVQWRTQDSVLGLIGGILVGTIAVSRLVVFGRVTGISGFVSKLFDPDVSEYPLFDKLKRLLFLGGLIIGGAIGHAFLPDSIEDWSALPLIHFGFGGVLVGLGTTIGNGCTSGHGVCGISDLRFRSLIATCVFMSFGIGTAVLATTASYLPTFSNNSSYSSGGYSTLVFIGICVLLVGLSILTQKAYSVDSVQTAVFSSISEVLFGASFGIAMCVSNMTKLSATISFLDFRHWNPALAFVMGGAIFIGMPGFYLVSRKLTMPTCSLQFHRPSSNAIDVKLVLGAAMFGTGWGLTGVCPGPDIANLGGGNVYSLIFTGFYLLGVVSAQVLLTLLASGSKEALVDRAESSSTPLATNDEDNHTGNNAA